MLPLRPSHSKEQIFFLTLVTVSFTFNISCCIDRSSGPDQNCLLCLVQSVIRFCVILCNFSSFRHETEFFKVVGLVIYGLLLFVLFIGRICFMKKLSRGS